MRRTTIAILLLVILTSTSARAHDVEADALIARGLELRRAGKPAEALELFRRAHREAPSPRTLGQMGLVETSLSHWIDAETHLGGALATPDDVWVHQNHLFLEQALDRAKDHIGELVISGRPGTEVVLAGKALGVLPLAAPVRAAEGVSTLTATASAFKPFSITVSIKGGARTAVTIVLEPLAVGAAMPAPAESFSTSETSPGTSRRWTGVALAVAGVGALAWGTTWIGLDNHAACGSTQSGSCGTVYDTRTAGWLLAAGGGALAVAGSVIFFSTLHPSNADLAFAISPRALVVQTRF